MTPIAMIGLGQMGRPMAANLARAFSGGVTAYDPAPPARAAAADAGVAVASEALDAAADAQTAVLALPAAREVRAALFDGGLLEAFAPGAVIVDCSTIDPDSARDIAQRVAATGRSYLDSPMSGGIAGAAAGRLTFMIGGDATAVARARPVHEAMGANIFHAGPSGAGAAAKLCNNMLLAVSMIGVAEALALAEKLGLDAQSFYDISSTATGRCWSLNDYCPAPGPVPAAPSNNGYRPGFSADLMLKDLRLAQAAAQSAGAATPLGAQATQIYALMQAMGGGGTDFSGVIKLIQGEDVAL